MADGGPNYTSPFWKVMAFLMLSLFAFACWVGKAALEETKATHDGQIRLEEGLKKLNESMNNYDTRITRTESDISDNKADIKVLREELADVKVRTRNLR